MAKDVLERPLGRFVGRGAHPTPPNPRKAHDMTDEKTGAGTGQAGDHPKPDSHMAGGEHMSGGGHMAGGAHMAGGTHMAGSGPLSNEAGDGKQEHGSTERAPQAPSAGRSSGDP